LSREGDILKCYPEGMAFTRSREEEAVCVMNLT
jgi:hypothetical protein